MTRGRTRVSAMRVTMVRSCLHDRETAGDIGIPVKLEPVERILRPRDNLEVARFIDRGAAAADELDRAAHRSEAAAVHMDFARSLALGAPLSFRGRHVGCRSQGKARYPSAPGG